MATGRSVVGLALGRAAFSPYVLSLLFEENETSNHSSYSKLRYSQKSKEEKRVRDGNGLSISAMKIPFAVCSTGAFPVLNCSQRHTPDF